MEIYISNLPADIRDESLSRLFAEHGVVRRAKVVSDRGTGLSRSYAFVTMDSDDEGAQAIQFLNGRDVQGRSLIVRKLAREQRPATSGTPADGRSGVVG